MAEVRYLKYNQSKPFFEVNLIRIQNVDWLYDDLWVFLIFQLLLQMSKAKESRFVCCIGLQTTESPLIQHPAEP